MRSFSQAGSKHAEALTDFRYRSGVVIAKLGVPIVLDLRGVGDNLQDHYTTRMVARVKGVETLNATTKGLKLAREIARWCIEYAQEIPVRVIAHMLGVPEQDAEQFRKWIKEILEIGISDYDVLMRAQREMIEYFADKIAIRRADPQEDLISYLINAHFENRMLSDDHINGTLRLLLIAGIDTTWSAIGSCLWHLAQHREDLRRIRSESGLMTSAIEEFLRAYAPVTMAREVVKETQIGGCTFKFGQMVLLSFPRQTGILPCSRTRTGLSLIENRTAMPLSASASIAASAPILPGWRSEWR